MTNTPTWNSWSAMRARCLSPTAGNFKRYGGKGITICKRWDKFENFLSDMGARPKALSLERRDSSKPYGPTNCKWANAKEQANNRISTRMIIFEGETMCLSDWARHLNIMPYALSLRIQRWGLRDALLRPPRANYRRKKGVPHQAFI